MVLQQMGEEMKATLKSHERMIMQVHLFITSHVRLLSRRSNSLSLVLWVLRMQL
jgi:hypothetical protein